MGEEDQTTKPRQFRVADGLWSAYDSVCKRLGRTRAEDLNAHMRQVVREHGTAEEVATLAKVEAELARRLDRKYSGLKSRQGNQPSED